MSNKHSLIFFWFLAIAISVLMMGYVFPHGNYHQPDLGWILYSVHAAARSMLHQDFVSLWRPGYLLNVPFVRWDFDYAELKWLYVICLFASTIWFVLTLDKQAYKRVSLPISILLMWTVYTCFFRFIFDYYGNVPLFLMLGLAAFNSAKGRFRTLFLLLSGLFFSQLVFANLALLPGVLVGLVILAFARRGSPSGCVTNTVRTQSSSPQSGEDGVLMAGGTNLLLILSFLIFLAITFALYLIPGHAWSIYQAHHEPSNLLKLLTPKFIIALGLLSLILVACWPFLFKDSFQKRRLWDQLLTLWAVLALFIFSYFSITTVFYESVDSYFFQITGVAAAYGGISSVLALLKPRLSLAIWRQTLVITTCIALVWFDDRVFSIATYVSWLFLPVILILFIVQIDRYVKSKWRYLYYLIFLIVLATQPLMRIPFINYQTPISINQYPSRFGVLTNKNTTELEKTLPAAYFHADCEEKPFLAFFDIPGLYFLVNRFATFGQSWVSAYPMIPESRQISAENLKHWFKQPHWCAAYYYAKSTAQGNMRFRSEVKLMKQQAKRHVVVGRLYGGNEVTLYVR